LVSPSTAKAHEILENPLGRKPNVYIDSFVGYAVGVKLVDVEAAEGANDDANDLLYQNWTLYHH